MGRGKIATRITAVLAVVIATVFLVAGRQEIAAWWRHQTVKDLLVPEKRDEALREILSWQLYRGEPNYHFLPTDVFPLTEVITCPQQGGPPIYALLFKINNRPQIHYELMDWDGTIIANSWGNKLLPYQESPQDLNGDGILEILAANYFIINGDYLRYLIVLPIDREMRPSLRLLVNEHWDLELKKTSIPTMFDIVLGPMNGPDRAIVPEAIFQWSPEEKRYLGPVGGFDQSFLRIDDGDDHQALLEQVERYAKKSDPH